MPACSARRAAAATQSSTDPSSWMMTAPRAAAPSTLEIGASRGMWTSHGTPRTRAANASACAWLPALPATTPSAACGPSAASLLSAPRTLNEPVRCSASALTRTSPPARSLSVSDGRTGVWRATSRTASRAAATSSAETERVTRLGHGDDGLEAHERAPRERRDAERVARGSVVLREELRVRLVNLRERAHVHEEDPDADRVREGRATRAGDRIEVAQALPRLVRGRGADDLPRVGVERDLPGAEQEVPRAHRVVVGPDGRRGTWCVHGLAVLCHV